MAALHTCIIFWWQYTIFHVDYCDPIEVQACLWNRCKYISRSVQSPALNGKGSQGGSTEPAQLYFVAAFLVYSYLLLLSPFPISNPLQRENKL